MSGFVAQEKLPYGLLRRFLGPVYMIDTVNGLDQLGADACALAGLAGVSRRSIARWKQEGVPLSQADRVACALGVHPSAIWHDAWWAGAERAEVAS